MTPDQDTATIPTLEQERPADPRPAWERIAYVWLAREVDADQPVDPTTLAGEVSVAPGFTRDLLRVLRGQRERDPGLGGAAGAAGARPDHCRLPAAGAWSWRAA